MYVFNIVLVGLAACASGVIALPSPQDSSNSRFLRIGKRDNTTSSTSDVSTTASSSTSVPVVLSTTSSASSQSVLSSVSITSNVVSLTSSTTSASASTTTTAPAIAVQGGTYTAVGCYNDVANTGFPLTGATLASSQSTAAQCLNLCASPGIGGPFTYAGVEGTQCFCSNGFASNAPQSPGACGGNVKRAGGPITIFQFTPSTSTSSTVPSTTSGTVGTQTSSQTALPTSNGRYTVQPGDTLSSIAQALRIPLSQLVALNPQISNPNNLEPYQVINIPSSAQIPTASYYTVRAGDTLSAIAQAFGVSLAVLEALNPQISNPNSIQIGQIINIPSSSVQTTFAYNVNAGDTLSAIAQAFNIPLALLQSLNPQITNPNLIYPGQVINIPYNSLQTTTTYTVQSGDTLASIAQRFGSPLPVVLLLNNQIGNPNLIYPGQVIIIPRRF